MSAIRKILLLVGSSKGTKSVSDAMGSYLLEMMTASGAEGRKIFIQPALKADPGGKELVAAFEKADMILLAFPLYYRQPASSGYQGPGDSCVSGIGQARRAEKPCRCIQFRFS
jgi:hypothetical protein